MKRKKFRKLSNVNVTKEMLEARASGLNKAGFETPKWILFCMYFIAREYTVTVYEARQTVSKYVTISKAGFKPYKVRFSDHKPIYERELRGDCDFFVGRTHLQVTTAKQAVVAVLNHFSVTPEWLAS